MLPKSLFVQEKVRMRVKAQNKILVGCPKRITLKNVQVFTR
jgi:hypothetical protein